MPGIKLARRITLAAVGGLLVLAGAVLMVLPGPGLLLVLAGVIVLAKEFPWAQRVYEPVERRALRSADASVATPWRTAASTAAGLALIVAGIMWIVLPWLPFGGVTTGSGVILSGVLLLALLGHSYRRLHRTTPAGEPGRAPSRSAE